jgi:hypothetical protein
MAVNRTAAMIGAGLLVCACGASPGVGPTPVSPPAPTPAASTYQLSGTVVDGAGRPVPDAAVSADLSWIMTDASGSFALTLRLHQPFATVEVQKAGYELSRHPVSLAADRPTVRQLRLHTTQRITAGESLHFSIVSSDPGCTFELFPCRRVRVVSPWTGLLRVDIEPDAPASRFAIIAAGDELPPSCIPLAVSVLVPAGAESTFDIVLLSASGGLTVGTALESR